MSSLDADTKFASNFKNNICYIDIWQIFLKVEGQEYSYFLQTIYTKAGLQVLGVTKTRRFVLINRGSSKSRDMS